MAPQIGSSFFHQWCQHRWGPHQAEISSGGSSFGLQAEVFFLRASGSMHGGLETAATPGGKVSFSGGAGTPGGRTKEPWRNNL